jgi:hypothetical protein
MGYELRITRAMDWLDSASNPISQEEWEAFTRRVPGLRPEGWVDRSDIGRQPVFAWTCDDGTVVSLSWRHGEVQVAGAFSDAATRSLVRLAESLNANLVGDDHERYDPVAARHRACLPITGRTFGRLLRFARAHHLPMKPRVSFVKHLIRVAHPLLRIRCNPNEPEAVDIRIVVLRQSNAERY